MNEIWMIRSGMAIRDKYGFFTSKEECQDRCDELTREWIAKGNADYRPHQIKKAVKQISFETAMEIVKKGGRVKVVFGNNDLMYSYIHLDVALQDTTFKKIMNARYFIAD